MVHASKLALRNSRTSFEGNSAIKKHLLGLNTLQTECPGGTRLLHASMTLHRTTRATNRTPETVSTACLPSADDGTGTLRYQTTEPRSVLSQPPMIIANQLFSKFGEANRCSGLLPPFPPNRIRMECWHMFRILARAPRGPETHLTRSLPNTALGFWFSLLLKCSEPGYP